MAHQGGAGLWPSNTLFAYQRAVELGVDVLEMDIQRTADGVLVVRHDPTVDSTTDGRGAIRDFTLAKLKALDSGYRFTPDGGQTFPFRRMGITIPTLEEVFQAFPGIRLNIDIKPEEPSVVDAFCAILRRHARLDQVIVGSFHDRQLHRFRQSCPEVATAAGVSETRLFFFLSRLGLARWYRPKADAFQIPEYAGRLHVVTPALIRSAHFHHLPVHVWTVNKVADMQRLIEWGVDGLISDYPDRLFTLTGQSA
jgi:glycerophosphoryl diester phosphodiesterase